MENKVVCYYCGTIYDEESGKCPLCGSTARAADSDIVRPVQRRRLPQERTTSGKNVRPRKDNTAPKGIKIAALVFLALTVLVVFYFIGDMIGWWPGAEDAVDREEPQQFVDSTNCEVLLLEPTSLEFSAVGESKPLTVSVNLSCEKKVGYHSEDVTIAVLSEHADTEMGEQLKTATFTVTALAPGETELVFSCGDKTVRCPVSCPEGAPSQAITVDENYQPVLNYTSDITLEQLNETAELRIVNLPENSEVLWRSGNEAVVSVNADGLITATGSGSTTVTAEVAGKTATVTVNCTFTQPVQTGGHLEKTDVTVSVGERFDLYLYDSAGEHIDDVTYTVKDPEICEVEDNYVTALQSGTTEVVVTYGTEEFTCIVRVN